MISPSIRNVPHTKAEENFSCQKRVAVILLGQNTRSLLSHTWVLIYVLTQLQTERRIKLIFNLV